TFTILLYIPNSRNGAVHCPMNNAVRFLPINLSVSEAAIAPADAHRNKSEGSFAVSDSIAFATDPSLREGLTSETFVLRSSITSFAMVIIFRLKFSSSHDFRFNLKVRHPSVSSNSCHYRLRIAE